MTQLARARVQLGQLARRPTRGRNLPQPPSLACKHDLARSAPAGTVNEWGLAKLDNRSTVQRDSLQAARRVKAERLPVGGEEWIRRAFGACDGRGFDLFEAAQ